ncbi:MAG: type II toxin-antitoxin system HicB family antitoxin [Nocardioidaceae bacterium]
MTATHYETLTEARKHIKDLLDAAEAGRPASVRRDAHRAAVVDADRLRYALSLLRPSRAEVVHEAAGWGVFLPGLPVAADGDTLDEAIDEMVAVLREYAEDWSDHLLYAPNHTDNWGWRN